jgi:hypothetical protein
LLYLQEIICLLHHLWILIKLLISFIVSEQQVIPSKKKIIWLSRIDYEVIGYSKLRFLWDMKILDGKSSSLIRKYIFREGDIYSLQSWEGTQYNNCLVLSGKFLCSRVTRSMVGKVYNHSFGAFMVWTWKAITAIFTKFSVPKSLSLKYLFSHFCGDDHQTVSSYL